MSAFGTSFGSNEVEKESLSSTVVSNLMICQKNFWKRSIL